MVQRSVRLAFFLSLILLSCCTLFAATEDYTYVIKGRVIDNHGNPVQGATIIPCTPDGECDIGIVGPRQTDSEGNFRFKIISSLSTLKRILYVTTYLPDNVVAPLVPPFRELIDTRQTVRGPTVSLKKNQETDLGSVHLQVKFGIIKLHLQSIEGKELYSNENNWDDFNYRIRNSQGDIVRYGGLSKLDRDGAVNIPQSTITIGLPEGTWQIEAGSWPFGDDPVWLTTEPSITVKASGLEAEKTLQFSLHDCQLSPCNNLSRDFTPEEARQELARLGFAYTKESFLTRASRSNTTAVSLFLKAGMNPEVKGGEWDAPPLFVAAACGDLQLVKLLLDSGADVNARNNHSLTVLMAGAGFGGYRITKEILEKGAIKDLKDSGGKTALIYAVLNKYPKTVQLLIEVGANVHVVDKKGRTALDYAEELDDAGDLDRQTIHNLLKEHTR